MDRSAKYQIHIPLPPKIDPSVTMMTVEEKPDITYAEVGGATEQVQKIREVVELPLLNVSRAFCLASGLPCLVLTCCCAAALPCSLSASCNWALTRPRVCCCTGRPARAR